MPQIGLQCACGKVQGNTEDINASSGTRLVCYCHDCQAFARFLEQEDTVLDSCGGTDIFQMPVSKLKVNKGTEHIGCVRLSSKGLYRWYAKCCNTPIGNTMGSAVPFIGVIHNFMDHATGLDTDLGEIRGNVETKSAKGDLRPDQHGLGPWLTIRSFYLLLVWKLKGLNTPSAFFDETGNPVSQPIVLE